jgi:hypothetical protein
MRTLHARRVLGADKRGSSWPVLVETEEEGETALQFTKLRGAAQGTGALVAEVIVAELAESLGLLVPARALVQFAEAVASVDENDELADLLRASAGLNLGFAYLSDASSFAPADDVARVGEAEAATILWLDGLVANPDRTARNPNLLWWEDGLWLIDHGAALGFQYALPEGGVTAARKSYALREPHLLHSYVSAIAALDGALAGRLTADVVTRAVSEVPDAFLSPLIAPDGPETLASRRAAYVDYLVRRLEPPRPFLAPEAAPNEQRRRGRPAWLSRQG